MPLITKTRFSFVQARMECDIVLLFFIFYLHVYAACKIKSQEWIYFFPASFRDKCFI